MNSIKKLIASIRSHLPAYLRNDGTPADEQKRTQKVASSTLHG